MGGKRQQNLREADKDVAALHPYCLQSDQMVRSFASPFLVWLFLVAAPLVCYPAVEPIKNNTCLECHSDQTLAKTNAAGREISLFVEETRLQNSVHKTNSCQDCHADIGGNHPDDGVAAKHVKCATCHEEQSESYGSSVHGLAMARGHSGSATCADCHGTHNIVPPGGPDSPLHFSRLAKTCGECHEREAIDLDESVHGKALAEGRREAPTCTDCHSEHRIEGLAGSSPDHISVDVCSNCHASERLNTKYRLPADRVKTFMESYHGLASKYGSTLAANCGSCHGYHRILPSSDPTSTISPKNLVRTCGKCHPGAGENFALSKVHVDAGEAGSGADVGQTVNWWVRRIYLVLIFGTIGGMLLHNGLTFFRKVRDRYRQADHSVLRMDLSQRAQHMTLAVSFIILAITGFALRFPESWVSKLLGSNEAFRSWTHRIAGVAMLLVGVYHVYYLIARREGRQLFRDMLPVRKDIKDLATNARYLSGLSREKARIGRFGYIEKAEYWAVVWGAIIMGGTGFMIWFKVDVTRFLPGWVVSVATTIHYYEAVLACLAILVWHFYHVMFDPDVYPMNWAAWNGKVSKEWQAEEHTVENLQSPLPGSHRAKKGREPAKSGRSKH